MTSAFSWQNSILYSKAKFASYSRYFLTSYFLQNLQVRLQQYMNHELLIAKFRLKLKKVGKITRSFRYDLNQIPYDYTVEVTKRFKGLHLIERVLEKLWMEVCDTVQEGAIKNIPRKRNAKRQNGCLRRPYK